MKKERRGGGRKRRQRKGASVIGSDKIKIERLTKSRSQNRLGHDVNNNIITIITKKKPILIDLEWRAINAKIRNM
jgi:hypothetical protein